MSESYQKPGSKPNANPHPGSPVFARRTRLENEISELEKELVDVANRLEKPGLESGQMADLQESYTDITLALEALIKEWQEDQ